MLGDIANLSLGLGAGVSRIGLNTEVLQFEDPMDPVVTSGQIINWTPDINLGVYLYGSQFFVGASMQQVLKTKLNFNDLTENGEGVPHYFVTGGYRFFIGEDVSVTPSLMLKYVNPLPKALDLNLKVAFRNNFWIGSSYRKKDALAFLAGFTVNKMFDVGYAYDSSISSIKTINSGSHEFVLGIKF